MARILDTIEQPADLKQLDSGDMLRLCAEIRDELVRTVSENGGHLASNLGVVELTATLLRCFNIPMDTVVFDVGHQTYVYKMLTGRAGVFHTLRKKNGLSGFPRPYESEYDVFTSGHSGTALSSAVGLARAKLLNDDRSKVIAFIGDGAFGSGMVYEAMNTIDASLKNLIVILNDNSMSISKSVGGISQYLLRLRTDIGYSNTKKIIRGAINKTPIIGEYLSDTIARSKAAFRRSIYDGRLFEEFGFNYIGPIDGHDIFELNRLFRNIKDFDGPMLIHVKTVKGKGFALAEVNPGAYHGVGKFNTLEGNEDISIADSFSNVFGRKLAGLSEHDGDICAVTAAMKYATGLNFFKRAYPERFFDVGIAEEHAVTFSAGLSKGRKKPVFAVYSTFLQRGYDQLFQDVALDSLDVMLAVDRAGLVGEDGETHHGLFDAAFLSSFGVFKVASPCNYSELEGWLEIMVSESGPRAIRYPRGCEDARLHDYRSTGEDYDTLTGENPAKALIVSYGRIFAEAIDARDSLAGFDIEVDLLKLNIISPLNPGAVRFAEKYAYVLFLEEGIERGGINEQFIKFLYGTGFTGRCTVHAVNGFVGHGSVEQLVSDCGLDAKSIERSVKSFFSEEST